MGTRKSFNLLLLGTAGSGKTQACAALLAQADALGIDAAAINLDPGVAALPYEPEVDVREWIDIRALMADQGLGPNGAQVVAADMMAIQLPKVMEMIESCGAELNIFDTPGQMELFTFRPASVHVLDHIGRDGSLLSFLHDATVCKDPRNLVSDMMLSAAAQMRLGAPSAHLLSKADLLSGDEAKLLDAWTQDPGSLLDALQGSMDDPSYGYARTMAMGLEDSVGGLELIPFSSVSGSGGEELVRLISNIAGWDDEES